METVDAERYTVMQYKMHYTGEHIPYAKLMPVEVEIKEAEWEE